MHPWANRFQQSSLPNYIKEAIRIDDGKLSNLSRSLTGTRCWHRGLSKGKHLANRSRSAPWASRIDSSNSAVPGIHLRPLKTKRTERYTTGATTRRSSLPNLCNDTHNLSERGSDDDDCFYYFKRNCLVPLIEGPCSLDSSFWFYVHIFWKEKYVKEEKQLVRDLISPPSTYIYVCTL